MLYKKDLENDTCGNTVHHVVKVLFVVSQGKDMELLLLLLFTVAEANVVLCNNTNYYYLAADIARHPECPEVVSGTGMVLGALIISVLAVCCYLFCHDGATLVDHRNFKPMEVLTV